MSGHEDVMLAKRVNSMLNTRQAQLCVPAHAVTGSTGLPARYGSPGRASSFGCSAPDAEAGPRPNSSSLDTPAE